MNFYKKIKLLSLTVIATPLICNIPYNNSQCQSISKLNEQVNLTWDKIDSLQNQLVNKFAAKEYKYLMDFKFFSKSKAQKKVKKDCAKINYGISLHNKDYLQFVNSDEKDSFIDECYEWTMNEANSLGIEIIDYDQEIDNFFSSTNKNKEVLVQKGMSLSDASKITEYLNDQFQNNLLESAKEEFWDSAELDLAIADLNAKDIFKNIYSKYSNFNTRKQDNDPKTNTKLNIVLAEIIKNLNTSLKAKVTEDDEAVKLFSYYSKDGKYSKEADSIEISPEDFCHLFTYDYDKSNGMMISAPDFNVVDIEPVYGEIENDFIQKVTLPFATYDGVYATYGLGEMFPGYTTHIKIADVDYNSDSHNFAVQYVFGVSETNHPENGILWETDLFGNNNDQNSVRNIFSYKVCTNDSKRYIAKHTYYNGWKATPDTSFLEDIDQTTGVYGDKTKKDRTTLEKILDKYPAPTVDSDGKHIGYRNIKDNPIELDDDDIKGLEINTIVDADGNVVDHDQIFHKYQSLKLMAFDVDTSKYTLSIAWAIVDEGSGAIYKLPWSGGTTTDENGLAVVQYKIDTKLSRELQFSTSIYSVLSSTYSVLSLVKCDGLNTENIESIEDKCLLSFAWHGSFLALDFLALMANLAILGFYTGVAIITDGLFADITCTYLVFIVLTVISLKALIKSEIKEISEISKTQDNFYSLEQTVKNKYIAPLLPYYQTINQKLIDAFPNDSTADLGFNPLDDQYATFSDKKIASDIVINETNNDEFLGKFSNFVKNQKMFEYDSNFLKTLSKKIDFDAIPEDDDESLSGNIEFKKLNKITDYCFNAEYFYFTLAASTYSVLQKWYERFAVNSHRASIEEELKSLKSLKEKMIKNFKTVKGLTGYIVLQSMAFDGWQCPFDVRDFRQACSDAEFNSFFKILKDKGFTDSQANTIYNAAFKKAWWSFWGGNSGCDETEFRNAIQVLSENNYENLAIELQDMFDKSGLPYEGFFDEYQNQILDKITSEIDMKDQAKMMNKFAEKNLDFVSEKLNDYLKTFDFEDAVLKETGLKVEGLNESIRDNLLKNSHCKKIVSFHASKRLPNQFEQSKASSEAIAKGMGIKNLETAEAEAKNFIDDYDQKIAQVEEKLADKKIWSLGPISGTILALLPIGLEIINELLKYFNLVY